MTQATYREAPITRPLLPHSSEVKFTGVFPESPSLGGLDGFTISLERFLSQVQNLEEAGKLSSSEVQQYHDQILDHVQKTAAELSALWRDSDQKQVIDAIRERLVMMVITMGVSEALDEDTQKSNTKKLKTLHILLDLHAFAHLSQPRQQ
jgi:hypothetical protein